MPRFPSCGHRTSSSFSSVFRSDVDRGPDGSGPFVPAEQVANHGRIEREPPACYAKASLLVRRSQIRECRAIESLQARTKFGHKHSRCEHDPNLDQVDLKKLPFCACEERALFRDVRMELRRERRQQMWSARIEATEPVRKTALEC